MGRWWQRKRACLRRFARVALALKRQGVTVDDAGKQVTAELKAAHPDWPNTNAAGFVKSVYAEGQ
jgi:hypothetical protein